jgi:hypothetical protein
MIAHTLGNPFELRAVKHPVSILSEIFIAPYAFGFAGA